MRLSRESRADFQAVQKWLDGAGIGTDLAFTVARGEAGVRGLECWVGLELSSGFKGESV